MRIIRRLRASFGICTPTVTIRPRMPWYLQGVALTLVALFAAALLWWFFYTGQEYAGFDRRTFEAQLADAKHTIQRLNGENSELRSTVDRLQQQSQIERAAQAELSRNIKQLQDENANLKEDVSFFRGIMSVGRAPSGLSIQNFRVEPDTLPDEYRFHVLLIQGGQRDQEFIGKAQVVVTVENNGATAVLIFPEDNESMSAFDVKLKYYQRLEGRFKVVAGTVIKSVQLRVIEKATGQIRLSRSLSLS